MPDLADTTRNYATLLNALYGADLPPALRTLVRGVIDRLSPEDKSLAATRLRGVDISHPAWVQALRMREELRARWQALFQQVDVILCPPMPTPAFPHDHSPKPTRQLDVDGTMIPYDDQIAWPGLAVLIGLPATTVPIGQTESGLPVGVQIIGGYLDDRTTITFAELIEQEFGGFRAPPGLA
jgi:amidase